MNRRPVGPPLLLDFSFWRLTRDGWEDIAVFPILADVVEVKTGSRSTAHWRIHFIRPNGWLRHSFGQLITLLDIDGIGQNWEGSNICIVCRVSHNGPSRIVGRTHSPECHRYSNSKWCGSSDSLRQVDSLYSLAAMVAMSAPLSMPRATA